MVKKTLKENPNLYILFINIAAVLYIVGTENIPDTLGFFAIGLFFGISILSLLAIWKKKKIFIFFKNLQFSIFFFILIIGLAQGLYLLFPSLYPGYLTNLIETNAQKEMKTKVVELLDESPFAKPKANVSIRVPGDYGSETDFEYEWMTDNRGYKNDPEIAMRNQFDVIALGDSFTEGLGVKTENTWISKLNSLGISAYSLGVQGYAPSQMSGTFKLFGTELKPKLVIIGYLTGTYDREVFFLKEEQNSKDKELPSAIGRLVKNDLNNNREYRKQFKFVFTAATFVIYDKMMDIYRSYIDEDYATDPRFIPEKLMVADESISVGKMQRYKKEIQTALDQISTKEKLQSRPEWEKTLASFDEIITQAKVQSETTILLVFHHRGAVYVNKATGQSLGENYQGFIEKELLRKFAAENGAIFLDTYAALEDYVKEINETTDISQYPYLKYDGHLSNKGNEIIAKLIFDYIKANNLLN